MPRGADIERVVGLRQPQLVDEHVRHE